MLFSPLSSPIFSLKGRKDSIKSPSISLLLFHISISLGIEKGKDLSWHCFPSFFPTISNLLTGKTKWNYTYKTYSLGIAELAQGSKSTHCSFRGFRFDSQHPQYVFPTLQQYVCNSSSRESEPFSGLQIYAPMWYTDTHVGKIPIKTSLFKTQRGINNEHCNKIIYIGSRGGKWYYSNKRI